jgi:AraC-like DNA-binding protein
LKLISERYAGKVTLAEISSSVGLVPAYFSALFHKLTGYSVFEYLNEYRIYKACELLAKTKKPVLELAYETGFNSISLFNRTFKHLTGKTPLKYRRTEKS